MAEIITIGEILVEVMAQKIGQSFEEPGEYVGPLPSGAPAIFIDQAAKTGSSCMIVSKVGNDSFGTLNVKRLQADGVDVRYIGTVLNKTTGIAFVTYKENGDRDFIYTLKDSAAAALHRQDIEEEMFEGCKYLHIMGCSAFNEEMIEVFKKAIRIAKSKNAKISFDPNIRKEIMNDPGIRDFILYVLDICDIFLPGQEELKWISGIDDEEPAARSVLRKNAACVVVKKGDKGCSVYEREISCDIAAYESKEVDPTGAGDCFAGTFISLLNQGKSVQEAVRYANASGAMAVMRKGPMEGTTSLEQLQSFMNDRNY